MIDEKDVMSPIQALTNTYLTLKGDGSKMIKESFWKHYTSMVDIEYDDAIWMASLKMEYDRQRAEIEEEIQDMVQLSFALAKAKKPVDIKRYITDQKSMYFPILFQPPIVTTTIPERRHMIAALYADWNPVEYVLLICELLDKKFAQEWKDGL